MRPAQTNDRCVRGRLRGRLRAVAERRQSGAEGFAHGEAHGRDDPANVPHGEAVRRRHHPNASPTARQIRGRVKIHHQRKGDLKSGFKVPAERSIKTRPEKSQ